MENGGTDEERKEDVPLQFRLEMDLVAVNDRLPFLVRRHERREAADLALAARRPVQPANQDVSELGGPHLGALLGRLPAHGRGLVVGAARLLDQAETRRQVRLAQAARPHQAERVRVLRLGVRPRGPVWAVVVVGWLME